MQPVYKRLPHGSQPSGPTVTNSLRVPVGPTRHHANPHLPYQAASPGRVVAARGSEGAQRTNQFLRTENGDRYLFVRGFSGEPLLWKVPHATRYARVYLRTTGKWYVCDSNHAQTLKCRHGTAPKVIPRNLLFEFAPAAPRTALAHGQIEQHAEADFALLPVENAPENAAFVRRNGEPDWPYFSRLTRSGLGVRDAATIVGLGTPRRGKMWAFEPGRREQRLVDEPDPQYAFRCTLAGFSMQEAIELAECRQDDKELVKFLLVRMRGNDERHRQEQQWSATIGHRRSGETCSQWFDRLDSAGVNPSLIVTIVGSTIPARDRRDNAAGFKQKCIRAGFTDKQAAAIACCFRFPDRVKAPTRGNRAPAAQGVKPMQSRPNPVSGTGKANAVPAVRLGLDGVRPRAT